MVQALPTDRERIAIGREARRRLARRSFRWFLEYMWPVIEPTRPLQASVAIDGVCAALQAVADGRIKRLGIAQPPGTSKSKAAAVAFPAYLELKTEGAARVMCGSYSSDFAERDSRHCRDLVLSPRYLELVGGRWSLRGDSSSVSDYWFTGGGRRMIVSPGGRSMGERCTFQIIDDALNSKDRHSNAGKRSALQWVAEMLPSRLEEQTVDPRVLVGQRLCVDDPMGWAIEAGWKILTLPALLSEGEEPCELLDDHGELVWRDPRKAGEPLMELLGVEALANLKREMGSASFSAQYLQKPHDESGGIFRRAWFGRTYTKLPEHFDRTVITLDASFKAGEKSDYAVIQAWGALDDDRYLIEQWRRQTGYVETREELRRFRERYPSARILVERAANGIPVIDELGREFGRGVIEEVSHGAGGKVAAAAAASPTAERGCIVLPENAPWLEEWIDEMTQFPNVKHDDQVDATCYALAALDDRGRSWPSYGTLGR